jgi:Protein of unknown function (DUF2877)
MAPRALFAGPGALRGLRAGRRGVVELVLARAAYVRLRDDWLLLAEPHVPFGPLSLAVPGLGRLALRPGQAARVDPGRLGLGDQAVSLERVRERRPAVSTLPSEAGDTAGAVAAALAVTGPPPALLAPGLVALGRGRISEGVGRLAGRGEGLTPAGDDALAGYAAWRQWIGAHVSVSALAGSRSSPLGWAYLRCAERGELPDAGASLLAALLSGDRHAATTTAVALRDWGASSGAALLWGIAAGATGGAWLHSPDTGA